MQHITNSHPSDLVAIVCVCLCFRKMLYTSVFIHYFHSKGKGLLTGDDDCSSTPDPSCGSESRGEVDHFPRGVGNLSNRDARHPGCTRLSLEASRKDRQRQGKAGSGGLFLLSVPRSQPKRDGYGLPSWSSKPSSWGEPRLPPKAA